MSKIETNHFDDVPKIVDVYLKEMSQNIDDIRDREPVLLARNFANAQESLLLFYLEENPIGLIEKLRLSFLSKELPKKLQSKYQEFYEYFDREVFANITHRTSTDLGDAPYLVSNDSMTEMERGSDFRGQSGAIDKTVGNARFVFANSPRLKSRSWVGLYQYELVDLSNCYVVPIDLVDITPAHLIPAQATKQNKDLPNAERLHYYSRNIFTFEDFKKFFALYCAVIFETPKAALECFTSFINYSLNYDYWLYDEEVIESSVDQRYQNEYRKMQYLFKHKDIIPPLAPEFQFPDNSEARKIS